VGGRLPQGHRREDQLPIRGSGAGLRQIEAKTVDFGASDAPLKDEDLAKKGLVQFPTVIGGVVPVVNIPGINPGQLKLRARCWVTSTWAK